MQIPILVYNVPSRTGSDVTNDTVARLAKLPNIVGIKDATGDLTRISVMRLECPEDFVLLSGDDPTALGYMAHGGHGCISVSCNVAPDAFAAFIKANLNQIAALTIVAQRPRDLTRAQLRELRLQLDAQGFTDAKIRRAWSDARNQDIAASIIGYVRQAALGDPLGPYGERVRRAVDAVIARGTWTPVQKRWLARIGEQLEKEIVVDRESLDEEPFRADGGFRVLNKRFDGRLESVLSDIRGEIWRIAS